MFGINPWKDACICSCKHLTCLRWCSDDLREHRNNTRRKRSRRIVEAEKGGLVDGSNNYNLVAPIHMGVSKSNGTPKSSILIGLFIINHPFWGTPIFGNIHISISMSSKIFNLVFLDVVFFFVVMSFDRNFTKAKQEKDAKLRRDPSAKKEASREEKNEWFQVCSRPALLQ